MRNRDYKKLAPGTIVHIYNRGNNREKIFLNEGDYRAFLFRMGLALGIEFDVLKKEPLLSVPNSRIRINAKNGLFKIHSFCLMPNHFHLLIEQIEDIGISKLISQICTSYAMYINKKYKRVGHVFQERFKSTIIENNPQLMWITAYIHMNPVKSGLVKKPEDYKWSSYNDFAFNRNLPIIEKKLLIETFDNQKNLIKETLSFNIKDVKDCL